MSHVTRMNESCHTCAWVVSLIQKSHATHMNESCHACELITSHLWMSHITHVNEWLMSHIECLPTTTPAVLPFSSSYVRVFYIIYMCTWMSRITLMNAWAMSHIECAPRSTVVVFTALRMSHGTHMNDSCHTHIRMTHVTLTYEWVMSHLHMNELWHT